MLGIQFPIMPEVPFRKIWQEETRPGRPRRHARSDEIAFRKRVAKRRAKKGYK